MMVHSAEIFSFFSNNRRNAAFLAKCLALPGGVISTPPFPPLPRPHMVESGVYRGFIRRSTALPSRAERGSSFARVFCADCFGCSPHP